MHLPYSRALFSHTKILDHVSRPNLALIRHHHDSGEVAEMHAYLFNLNVSSKEIAALCSSSHSAMMPPIQNNVS
jgi:phosphoribosylformylglycinamidine (FGAM) synthase-like amidotransferase family enzyme